MLGFEHYLWLAVEVRSKFDRMAAHGLRIHHIEAARDVPFPVADESRCVFPQKHAQKNSTIERTRVVLVLVAPAICLGPLCHVAEERRV